MDNILRLAFIGGGISSAVGRAHFISCALDAKFKLVAGCFSRNYEANKQSAASYGISEDKCYRTLEELVKNEKDNIDAIVILTPITQHCQNVIYCLENDIPVICEKSLTSSISETKIIKDYCEKNSNKFLCVVYNYLGYPAVREIENIIKAGKIGNIKHIRAEMPSDGYLARDLENKAIKPQEWRLKDCEIPTISLDLGTHIHSMISYLSKSNPKSILGCQSSKGNFSVIDNVYCIAKYDNDIDCEIWYSKSAIGYKNGLKIEIFGDVGSVSWTQTDPENITLSDNLGNKQILNRGSKLFNIGSQDRYSRFKAGHPAGYIEALANYYWDVYEALIEYKQKKKISNKIFENYSVETAIKGLEMLDLINISSREKTWKSLT
jgi:predicted dehydrogenase